MVDPESYVDINIFVYWLGNHPTFGKPAYNWIKKIEEAQRGKYVTSSLSLYQTLVIIAGITDQNLKDRSFIENVITPITSLAGLVITPLNTKDFTKAINLMTQYSLDYEDALHLAVALRSNVKEIISNDEDFDKTPLKRTFL